MFKRQTLKKWGFAIVGLIAFIGFIALGNWQLERRTWKLDLIQRVEERVHAQAEAAPSRESWANITKAHDEYRKVFLTGSYVPNQDALVVAATEHGSGYWVLTPFKTQDNSVVYINRGFITQGVKAASPPVGQQQVIGLLRLSEPKGSVLRDNDPSSNRWYSRDTQALATKHNIVAAPFFIDIEKSALDNSRPLGENQQHPIGGLTIINFHNSHLIYAITWYGLAAMVVVAGLIVIREERGKS